MAVLRADVAEREEYTAEAVGGGGVEELRAFRGSGRKVAQPGENEVIDVEIAEDVTETASSLR